MTGDQQGSLGAGQHGGHGALAADGVLGGFVEALFIHKQEIGIGGFAVDGDLYRRTCDGCVDYNAVGLLPRRSRRDGGDGKQHGDFPGSFLRSQCDGIGRGQGCTGERQGHRKSAQGAEKTFFHSCQASFPALRQKGPQAIEELQ